MFLRFQRWANWYWEKRHFELVFYCLLGFSMLFLLYYLICTRVPLFQDFLRFLSPLWIVNFKKIEYDFGFIFAVLELTGMLFGFGVAFIGSQSIEYSLTKILLRYKYFQILSINLLLLFLFFSSYNYDPVLKVLISLWLFYLYIHTFFLIDKMFDPEEVIIDVVIPSILLYENEHLRCKAKKERGKGKKIQSGLYGILEGWRDKRKPLIYNDANVFVHYSNAELDVFGKALKRLIKRGSLKLNHLLNQMLSILRENKAPYPKFYSDYNNKCDIRTYIWFLLTYLIYQVFEARGNDDDYDSLRTTLLLQIVTAVLSADSYPKESSPFFNTLEDHVSLFDNSGTRGQELVIDIIDTYLNRDDEAFTPDKNEQIAKFAQRLIGSFLFQKMGEVISLNRNEIDYFLSLIGLANSIYATLESLNLNSRERAKFVKDFLLLYTNMIMFFPIFNDALEAMHPVRMEAFNSYLDNLFLDNFERNRVNLAKFLSGEMALVGFGSDFYKKKTREALNHLARLNIVSAKVKERIKSI